MPAIYLMFIVSCTSTSAFATKAVERFETPHWISLLPQKLDKQLSEMQNSSAQKTDQSCQKEREEHWDLQMKASEIAERGKADNEYVDAADKAEAAARREQECRKTQTSSKPLTFAFDLHSAPDATSETIGQLVIEVGPWLYDADENGESQIKTIFVDKENKSTAFTADVPHPFNGKPAVFHTLMAKAGSWYQLPPKPFPKPVWVDFSGHAVGAPLSILKINRPVFVKTGEAGTYVVFSERKGRKLIGNETMEDRRRAAKKTKSVEINLSELFDSFGHIRAKWRADDED